MKYTLLSLFSGGMGLDLGLDRTGRFGLLACVERDAACCRTIRVNRDAGRLGDRSFRLYEADIESLNPCRVMADLRLRPGDLDLLAGGPPCTTFSTAGRRQGVADARGLLLWQFLWFVEALRPRVFLIENVRGLMSAALRPGGQPGLLLRAFLHDLPAEYRVDVFEVNAANYGTPQVRERVILLGNRHGGLARPPGPTHGPGLLPYRTLRDALAGVVDHDSVLLDFSERKKQYLKLVPPGGNWRDLPDHLARESMEKGYFAKGGRLGWWRRLAWDWPSPTILTNPSHPMTSLCHPDETRTLTLRECARIQGFPDDWAFCGSAQDMYRQVGNAVPVGLGEVCGEVVASLLAGIRAGAVADGDMPRCRTVNLNACVQIQGRKEDGDA